MPDKAGADTFLTFHYMLMYGSLRRGGVIDVIYDTEGHMSSREGQYGFT